MTFFKITKTVNMWAGQFLTRSGKDNQIFRYLPCNLQKYIHTYINKHLMTGPKGNSEFCFPETLNVPRGEAERNIEGCYISQLKNKTN